MRKVMIAGAVMVMCVVTGCNAQSADTNVKKGMELLEQMDNILQIKLVRQLLNYLNKEKY